MEENDKYEGVVSGDGGEESGDVAEVSSDDGGASTDQLQTLKEERDNLYDRLVRKQAEFENYKKRIDRERSEFVQFASSELMRELLNALDSFDLALRNAAAEASAREVLRGFELIYKQLQDTLGRFGLKTVEAKGQTFDPHLHQAVATKATNEVEENTVIEEMRKGYLLNGRLLRPAMVTVAVKKE